MPPRSRGGSGGLSRRAALALIGGGGLLGISASGAFDQVGASRPFELGVDDETALLGIETFSPIEVTSSNSTRDVVELHNRFSEAEFTSISVSSNSGLLSIEAPLSRGETLGPNEKLTVQGTISATRSRTEDVTLTIEVRSERERIETTRVVTVDIDLGQRPAACPVSLDAVTVGEEALGTQHGDDIDLSDVEIDGDVLSNGGVDLRNVTVTGDVIADGDIDLRNTTVGGTVTADGDIDILGGAVHGGVEADGDIDIRGQQDVASVRDTVQADGDVDLRGVTIGGDVESDGDIAIRTSNTASTVCGTLNAGGTISLSGSNRHAAETGPIQADGDVTVRNHATVFGTVDSSGDVTVRPNGVVKGDINAAGDVTVRGTVDGGVFAGGEVSGNGTIHGNDPRESDDGGGGPP